MRLALVVFVAAAAVAQTVHEVELSPLLADQEPQPQLDAPQAKGALVSNDAAASEANAPAPAPSDANAHARALLAAAEAMMDSAAFLPPSDARRVVLLYARAAQLRAGPASAAALTSLARMFERGWDGSTDTINVGGDLYDATLSSRLAALVKGDRRRVAFGDAPFNASAEAERAAALGIVDPLVAGVDANVHSALPGVAASAASDAAPQPPVAARSARSQPRSDEAARGGLLQRGLDVAFDAAQAVLRATGMLPVAGTMERWWVWRFLLRCWEGAAHAVTAPIEWLAGSAPRDAAGNDGDGTLAGVSSLNASAPGAALVQDAVAASAARVGKLLSLLFAARGHAPPPATVAAIWDALSGAESAAGAAFDAGGDDATAGYIVQPYIHAAVALYAQAAAAGGSPEAHYTMGVLHAHGVFGVPHSDAKAVLHYFTASLGGHQDALLAMGVRHAPSASGGTAHASLAAQTTPQSCPAAAAYLEPVARRVVAAVDASFGLLQHMPTPLRERLDDDGMEELGLMIDAPDAGILVDGDETSPTDLQGAFTGMLARTRHLHAVRSPATTVSVADPLASSALTEAGATDAAVATHTSSPPSLSPTQAAARFRRSRVTRPSTSSSSNTASTASATGSSDVLAYFHNAADRGDLSAHVALGHLYLLGARGAEQSLAQAAEHFHAAAEHNESLSMANLGYMYLHGLGVPPSTGDAERYQAAKEFLLAAVQPGTSTLVPAAAATLGHLYLKGLGVKKNTANAYRYFKKAAAGQQLDAMHNVALMDIDGTSPDGRDFKSALSHLQQAAGQGHLASLYRLGLLQLHGIGGARDCPSAVRAFRAAIGRLQPATSLDNALPLLALGNAPAALLEYLRAGEAGWELGQWNAAYLLIKGRVPEAVFENVLVAHAQQNQQQAGALPIGAQQPSAVEAARSATGGSPPVSPMPQPAPSAAAAEDASVSEQTTTVAADGSLSEPVPVAAAATSPGGDSRINTSKSSATAGDASKVAVQQQQQQHGVPPTVVKRARPSAAPSAVSKPPKSAPLSMAGLLPWLAYGSNHQYRAGTSVESDSVDAALAHAVEAASSRRALRLLQSSAAHGYGPAHLLIGDGYYYGMGGLQRSMRTAADHYISACNAHVPQACYSIAWLHALGAEGIERDPHMAKRFFDLTLEHTPGALAGSGSGTNGGRKPADAKKASYGATALPVRLSIWYLQAVEWYEWLRAHHLVPLADSTGTRALLDKWLPPTNGTAADAGADAAASTAGGAGDGAAASKLQPDGAAAASAAQSQTPDAAAASGGVDGSKAVATPAPSSTGGASAASPAAVTAGKRKSARQAALERARHARVERMREEDRLAAAASHVSQTATQLVRNAADGFVGGVHELLQAFSEPLGFTRLQRMSPDESAIFVLSVAALIAVVMRVHLQLLRRRRVMIQLRILAQLQPAARQLEADVRNLEQQVAAAQAEAAAAAARQQEAGVAAAADAGDGGEQVQ